MVRFCADFQYPVALRYPRGAAYEGLSAFRTPIVYGKSEILYEEEDIAVIFVGHMAELAVQVRDRLERDRISLLTDQCQICKASGYRDAGSSDKGSQTFCDD